MDLEPVTDWLWCLRTPVVKAYAVRHGPLHIGHYFGTLENRVRLQGLVAERFVLVADFLRAGNERAREIAAATLGEVHGRMGIAY
jgi:hypothetical protein